MPFRTNEPTIPNALPIRSENGTLIGAIARTRPATQSLPGWGSYVLNHTGDGFVETTHGGHVTPTEADASVRAEHALLVRMGDR